MPPRENLESQHFETKLQLHLVSGEKVLNSSTMNV
jgi:hypothetical protein